MAGRVEQVVEQAFACSKVITELLTEMPRSCSIFIQSERDRRRSPRALTSPAMWMAPPANSSFSVKVVLPASGWEMIAKVRRGALAADMTVWLDRSSGQPDWYRSLPRRSIRRAEDDRSR